MDAASNKAFLERVQDVPGLNGPGHLGVFTHLRNSDPQKNSGKPFMIGWPCKTVDQQISKAFYIAGHMNFHDVWFCTSRQSETGTNAKGKPKAVRLAKNATSLKAIWVDVDVKAEKPDKNYTTLSEALDATLAFIKAVGLPSPSALVSSGGGLHIYWISDVGLPTAEWQPYAEGLKALLLREGVKCDAGLTTDEARILRVPGTLNHKYDPPRPVVLMSLGQDYNFGKDLSFLKNFAVMPVMPTHTSAPVDFNPFDEDADPTSFDVQDPAFAGLDASEKLGDKTKFEVLFEPVKQDCEFYRDAVATGGKDHDNNLWNLAVLGTVFMENGNAIAHQVSQSHPGYSTLETQALYDRKLADRSHGTVGYPSCAAIKSAGCKSCETCPLFAKGKSPLSIRPPPVIGAHTITVAVNQSAAAVALELPAGYDIDPEGRIAEVEQKKLKDGTFETSLYPLFYNKILTAFAQTGPDKLNLHFTTDLGNSKFHSFRPEEFTGAGGDKALAKAGLRLVSKNKGRIEGFLMSFLAKMNAAAAAQKAVGFGWYEPKGYIEGFAFGGELCMTDGTAKPAASISDANIVKLYAPTGSAQVWYDAWEFIKMQKRPELDLAIVAAFAAPLMALSGVNGSILSLMGEKGAGKTFAMEIGCAVWGHPTKTRAGDTTTEKAVELRLAATQNLPAYWDEVTEESVQQRVLRLVNITTSGASGGRSSPGQELRDQGSWSTMVIINGNKRFKDFICKKQKDHGASLNRVFEVWVTRSGDDAVGKIKNTSISDQARQKLNNNFGIVGMDYAKLLANNVGPVQALLDSNIAMFNTQCGTSQEERMWLCTMGALLTGAELANQLPQPVGFNVVALKAFLLTEYVVNKKQRDEAIVDPSNRAFGDDFLAEYLRDRTNQTIYTEAPSGPKKAGRPDAVQWYRVNTNAPTNAGMTIRWDKADATLRFAKSDFDKWCSLDPGRVPSAIISNLKLIYKLFAERRSLGIGTPFNVKQETVYTIPLAGHDDLLEILLMHSPNMNRDLGMSTGPEVPDETPPAGGVVTGLTATQVKKIATDVGDADKVKVI